MDRHITNKAGYVVTSVLLISGALLGIGIQLSPLGAVDDAYITYRYADNLGRGLGLVYNPQEWVLGTTTPLFAFILGLLRTMSTNTPLSGQWVSIIAWIASLWFAAALLWHFQRPIAACLAAILLALQSEILLSVGMETALVIALMFGAAWAWLGKRRWLSIAAAAALILTRQDGTLWVIFLGLEAWRRDRRFPWFETLAVLGLTAPWFLYAYWQYGMLLPNSALAKIGQTSAMAVSGQGTFVAGFLGRIQGGSNLPFLLLVLAAALLGVRAIIRRLQPLWVLPIWLISYLAIYTVLGVANFDWYFAPPLSVVALLVAIGLDALWHEGTASYKIAGGSFLQRWPVFKIIATLGTILIVAGYLVQFQAGLAKRSELGAGGRLQEYHAAGAWLAENAGQTEKVAALEIGIVGYRSQRNVIDTLGLITPAMRSHLTGWQDIVVYAITTFWPEYFIALPQMAVVQQWWFVDHYEAAARFGDVTVYRRSDLPATETVYVTDTSYADILQLKQVSLASQYLDSSRPLDFWATVKITDEPPANYQFTWFLADVQDYSRTASTNLWPYGDFNLYQSSHWQPGDQLTIPFRLPLTSGLSNGTYRLGLVVYDTAAEQPVGYVVQDGQSADELLVNWLRVGDPPIPVNTGETKSLEAAATWENFVRLEAVRLPVNSAAAGATVPIDLQWQVLDKTDRDATVYVHLLDAENNLLAQQDRKPYDGRFPTPVWQPGESLVDRYTLVLPPNITPGNYTLCTGFYDEQGRLARSDADSLDGICLPSVLAVE